MNPQFPALCLIITNIIYFMISMLVVVFFYPFDSPLKEMLAWISIFGLSTHCYLNLLIDFHVQLKYDSEVEKYSAYIKYYGFSLVLFIGIIISCILFDETFLWKVFYFIGIIPWFIYNFLGTCAMTGIIYSSGYMVLKCIRFNRSKRHSPEMIPSLLVGTVIFFLLFALFSAFIADGIPMQITLILLGTLIVLGSTVHGIILMYSSSSFFSLDRRSS